MNAGRVLRVLIAGLAIVFVAIVLADGAGITQVHRWLAGLLFGPSAGEAAPWQQWAYETAIWLQDRLANSLPARLAQPARRLPPVVFIIIGPLILFAVGGLGLKKLHDSFEGYRKTGGPFKKKPASGSPRRTPAAPRRSAMSVSACGAWHHCPIAG